MIALYKNGQPELLSTMQEVTEREKQLKDEDPSVDLEKRQPVYCAKCGSANFDHLEAATCPCDEW
ncbi:hypothetical protein [Vibrio owensii]|uniref:hypothetical protein n=1 Tax=Vibrio harveyi group TaxID=717610 RepID=UPI003CC5E9DE